VYECSPDDRGNLESIQQNILERLRELREQDLPLREDSILQDYYELNAQIQDCILHDYSFSPITMGVILGIGVTVVLGYYFRIWKKRKQNSKSY
jgi:hypothetical protein